MCREKTLRGTQWLREFLHPKVKDIGHVQVILNTYNIKKHDIFLHGLMSRTPSSQDIKKNCMIRELIKISYNIFITSY